VGSKQWTDSGRACRRAGLDLLDDRGFIGPAAANQSNEEAALTGGDGLTIDDDIKLARGPLRDLDLKAELVLNLGGETRRAALVTSRAAVENADLHDISFSLMGGSTPFFAGRVDLAKRGAS